MSTRPASCGFNTAMTLPMPAAPAAPVDAMAAAMALSTSASDSCAGMYVERITISARSASARSLRLPASNCVTESLRCLIILSMIATTSASESSTRSSTSRCFSAASSSRMVDSRAVSRARIAAFMSSVMRCLSGLIGGNQESEVRQCWWRVAARLGGAWAKQKGRIASPLGRSTTRSGSEQLGRQLLAADAFVVALDRGGFLALALGGGLFVELARAQFRQQAGLFDRALEAAKGCLEELVFADADTRHKNRFLWKNLACKVNGDSRQL